MNYNQGYFAAAAKEGYFSMEEDDISDKVSQQHKLSANHGRRRHRTTDSQTNNIVRDDNIKQSQQQQYGTIRFAEDTRMSPVRGSSSSNQQVLVLGGSSNSSSSTRDRYDDDQQDEFISPKNSLNFSMLTTPGGGGFSARLVDEDGNSIYTPSEANTTSSSGRFSSILRGVPNMDPRQLLPSSTPKELNDEEQNTNTNDNNECTALQFAKSAPLSGYLKKLGRNIPKFKRRFFVLKPSTHLYYFMSPNDVEPRGCIDLDMIWDDNEKEGRKGCEVREINTLPDGTFRFELLFDEEVIDNGDDNASTDTSSRTSSSSTKKSRNFQRQSIVLEARTEEMGREWMTKLQSERLSYARNEVNILSTNLVEMKSISTRWETSACEAEMRADDAERQRNISISEAKVWETKYNNLNEAIRLFAKTNTQQQEGSTSSSEFLIESLAGLDVNDSNFDDMSEAFQKLKDGYSLLSKREEDANQRISELEQRVKEAELQAKNTQAELTKVWEDNRAMQDELKKTKREKRILVKEVKSLHATAEENASKQSAQHDLRSANSSRDGEALDTASITQPSKRRMNDEEKRLVIELEEHVMSGLRLSEQFLTLNGIDPSEVGDDHDSCAQASSTQASLQASCKSPERRYHHSPQKGILDLSPHTRIRAVNNTLSQQDNKPLASLLDDNDEEDDESEVALVSTEETESTDPLKPNNKKVDTVEHDNAELSYAAEESTQGSSILNDVFQYEEAPSGEHINQNLDDRFREQRESSTSKLSPVEASTVASSYSESSRSRVTDNGNATTKLECPLRDMGETPHPNRSNASIGDDGKVYHITFYSKKIGLQFQKVPNQSKGPGLLTEAMTADHGVETNQTASELRRIASISQNTKKKNKQDNLECLPTIPVDAVLVCGFVGFDDSNNVRPRTGSRLVAFDGIPITVGNWTFEVVRQSIQARGRPLTLSFRNDFLTTKQREILTKAVGEIGLSPPPPQSIAQSYDSRGTTQRHHEQTIHRSTSSVSSNSQPKSGRYYSFSEAGSLAGSSISSAVPSLVSNLLANSRRSSATAKQKDDEQPSYLERRSPDEHSMDKMRVFQSGLL